MAARGWRREGAALKASVHAAESITFEEYMRKHNSQVAANAPGYSSCYCKTACKLAPYCQA